MPHEYIIMGEQISPYLVFTNTHDGSGALRAAVTPIRVVCKYAPLKTDFQRALSTDETIKHKISERMADISNEVYVVSERESA